MLNCNIFDTTCLNMSLNITQFNVSANYDLVIPQFNVFAKHLSGDGSVDPMH